LDPITKDFQTQNPENPLNTSQLENSKPKTSSQTSGLLNYGAKIPKNPNHGITSIGSIQNQSTKKNRDIIFRKP